MPTPHNEARQSIQNLIWGTFFKRSYFLSLIPSPLFAQLPSPPVLCPLPWRCGGWAPPHWLQAVPMPGLTSRHCFCQLNRINKSMCQVDCSQETMTHFWHRRCHPLHLPGSLFPPSASLQLLIKKTLLSWLYVLPRGSAHSFVFIFFPSLHWIKAGSHGKKNVRWSHVRIQQHAFGGNSTDAAPRCSSKKHTTR